VKRGSLVSWEAVGIAIALILAVVNPDPTTKVVLIAGGTLLLLVALRLPQRLGRAILRTAVDLTRTVQSEYQTATAIHDCETAITGLSGLLSFPSRVDEGRLRLQLGRLQIGGVTPRSAVHTYRTEHRASIVVAVEEALAAGAIDNGILTRARDPRSTIDLHELLAGLVRMVGELDQEATSSSTSKTAPAASSSRMRS